jgi:radical SAM protein with 4Fe4S-binding SPASM domain
MADSPPDDILSWENLIYIADLLETSGWKSLSLLGGEPFLHPYFVDFVLYLIERGLHVNVFTSGVMSERMFMEAADALSGIHPEKLSFVCNINNPKSTPFSELENIKRFLKHFSHLTTAGFNIHTHDFEMDFLFQFINEFGLKRHIRIGLAHPIPGKKNIYIHPENLQKMADRFMSYVPVFERLKIEPGFDCGMPLCLFSDEQLGRLFKLNRGNIVFGCGPALDIGPDMTVWSCFPLSNFQEKSLFDFNSMQEIVDFYESLHKKIRIESGGLFEKCDTCLYLENGLCKGGCVAHNLSRFMNEAPVRFKEVYPNE